MDSMNFNNFNVDNDKSEVDKENLNVQNMTSDIEIGNVQVNEEVKVPVNQEMVNTYRMESTPNPEPLKDASFYTESYRKQSKKRSIGLVHMVIVAVISSILGGFAVGAFFYFVTPVLQPSANSFLDNLIPGSTANTNNSQSDNAGVVKKVEIEKTDSPVSAIAEKVSPSIVGIRVTATVSNFIFGEQQGTGEGSGIIIKEDGYIITNFHVVENALNSNGKVNSSAKIEVILPSQVDKAFPAEIVGYDTRTDLAVIKIDKKGLPVAEFGDSDKVKVGELAVAIGNPGGLEYMGSVSVGVISGLNRTIPLEGIEDLKLIQTDAAINPGNSGGALINSSGQVIGINNAKMGGDGFEGLGFAIPINTVKEISQSLMEFKIVKRPMLGITAEERFTEEYAKQMKVPFGVMIADVVPLSGAYKAGLKIMDIITKYDGKEVTSVSDIRSINDKHKIGDTIEVEYYRDGKTLKTQVILSEDMSVTQ